MKVEGFWLQGLPSGGSGVAHGRHRCLHGVQCRAYTDEGAKVHVVATCWFKFATRCLGRNSSKLHDCRWFASVYMVLRLAYVGFVNSRRTAGGRCRACLEFMRLLRV